MTNPSERMSEAEKMPPKVTKDDWTHPDRIAWIKESTDTLSSFGGHVVHDLADAITQLRTDLAVANERAESAEKDRDHWKGEYHEWEEREAAACPEDCPFEEVIDTLRTQLAEAVEGFQTFYDAVVGEHGECLHFPPGTYISKYGSLTAKHLHDARNTLSRLTTDADAIASVVAGEKGEVG
jgi:hypothetical protein